MAEQTVQHDFDAAVRVAAQFEDIEEKLRLRSEHDRAGDFGYVAHACSEVERAIFDALNCLSSYLGDEAASKLLSEGLGWQDAKREARKVPVSS